MSIFVDTPEIADDTAADVLESWSVEDVRRLIEEMEAELRTLH
jgi:hypothetical protein